MKEIIEVRVKLCDRFFTHQASHQHIGQVVCAVVISMFLSLPVHRQSVVIILRVLLLERNNKINSFATSLFNTLHITVSKNLRRFR